MLLLEQRGEEIKITEEVTKAAAGNWDNGKELMVVLLEQRGEEIKITEEIIKAAADNWSSGKEVMKLLLEQRGDEIKVTEKIIETAAGNRGSGKDVIMLLLEPRGEEVRITENVIKAAAEIGDNCKEVLKLLLNDWLSSTTDKKQHISPLIADNTTILLAAVMLDNKAVVEQFIKSEIDVNNVIGEYGTALYIAAQEGYDSMVHMLLSKGADFDLMDSHGWTPYTTALASRKDSICRILSNYGCKESDLENSIGFVPDKLNKAVISSEVTILEDGCTAMTGISP